MAREIRPLEPDDIPEVSRFLTEGFGAPANADFAAPDVLRWKYVEPRDDRHVTRSLVALDEGRIVGHGGMVHGWFHVSDRPDFKVSTFHGIDWISSPSHPTTGAYLLRRGHRLSETHYALNYSDAARRVIERAGYRRMATVPVFQKVLRMPRLRNRNRGILRVLPAAVRDLVRLAVHRARRPEQAVELERVAEFGSEVKAVLAQTQPGIIYTSRDPAWLNHALRCPRGRMSGWLVRQNGELVGFALLNVVETSGPRMGKLVECFLSQTAPSTWQAVVYALTHELHKEGAELAETFGSTPWMAEALEANGYFRAHQIHFLLDDPHSRLPQEGRFHLTPFEADYAYF